MHTDNGFKKREMCVLVLRSCLIIAQLGPESRVIYDTRVLGMEIAQILFHERGGVEKSLSCHSEPF